MANSNSVSIAELFDQAVCLPTHADRRAFLHQACAGDTALRDRVEALLRAHETSGDFLEHPAMGVEPLPEAPPLEAGGTVIGKYKLLEEIGEGGFGVVWMAEQHEPVKRRVALKIIKLGMDTKQVIARFEAERQTLAMMDHPNIAKVLDAGATTTGRPYFVMEYIRGVPLLQYCDTERLNTKSRIGLFIGVCNAIQHAHQKGTIHRDIKPSNVLVTMHDGIPVPKVIDFGIAKATNQQLTEKTLFTQHRQMIGTPAYMSPEQAEMNGLDVDTRSDIYSLGVLLYELLTGTTPFDPNELISSGFVEMVRTIRETEPDRPSTRLHTQSQSAASVARGLRPDLHALGSELSGDLDWIVMRCLEKDRSRRYDTANALAMDLKRHLADEPVTAGPPTARYRLGKFIKRNRTGVIAGSVMVALLVLAVVGTSAGLFWALSEKTRADENAGLARANEKAASAQAQRATEVKRLVTQMLSHVNPLQARGADITLLRGILDDTAQRLADGEVTDELIAAELHHIIGVVYRDLGLWSIAEMHIPRALEIRSRLLGPDDPATLQTAHELLDLYGYLGRTKLMEPLALDVVERRTRRLGPEHPDTLKSMETLAAAYGGTKRYNEAEAIVVKVLAIRTRVLGPEHRDTLQSLSHLSLVHFYLGRIAQSEGRLEESKARLAQAEHLMVQSVETRRRVLGEDDPDLLPSMGSLVSLYESQGRFEESLPCRRELVHACRRVLGEQHPYTVGVISRMAILYTLLGRLDDACSELENELQVKRSEKGMRHPQTWGAMVALSKAYDRAGRNDQALALCHELLDVLPTDSSETSASPQALSSMAWALSRTDADATDTVSAVDLAQRAVELAETNHSPRLSEFLDTLAGILYRNGAIREAVEAERRASSAVPDVDAIFLIRAGYEADLYRYEVALQNGSMPAVDQDNQ